MPQNMTPTDCRRIVRNVNERAPRGVYLSYADLGGTRCRIVRARYTRGELEVRALVTGRWMTLPADGWTIEYPR